MPPRPGRSNAVRVVLVDSDDRVRESLCGLLCIGDRIEVVGNAGDAASAVDVVLATEPDIVVLDPRLPQLDGGLSLIRKLRSVAPGVKIVVLSHGDASDSSEVGPSADALIRKTYRPSELVAAVLAAAVPLTA